MKLSCVSSTFSLAVCLTLSLVLLRSVSFAVDPVVNECYECVEGVNEKCADPFDLDDPVVKGYLKKCFPNQLPKHPAFANKTQALGCRKILQEINEVIHVVRECAWSGENAHNVKRTGNKGVRLFYYQCETEKCNTATSLTKSSFVQLKTVSALVFSFFLAFIVGS